MSKEQGKSAAPTSVWVVVDGDLPVFVAPWPGACHEHINDAIGLELEAATWVVREYVLKEA